MQRAFTPTLANSRRSALLRSGCTLFERRRAAKRADQPDNLYVLNGIISHEHERNRSLTDYSYIQPVCPSRKGHAESQRRRSQKLAEGQSGPISALRTYVHCRAVNRLP